MRYFLNVEFYDQDPLPDDEGALFQSRDAALAEAKAVTLELITAAMCGDAVVPRRIVIVDESGREVGMVRAVDFVPHSLRQSH